VIASEAYFAYDKSYRSKIFDTGELVQGIVVANTVTPRGSVQELTIKYLHQDKQFQRKSAVTSWFYLAVKKGETSKSMLVIPIAGFQSLTTQKTGAKLRPSSIVRDQPRYPTAQLAFHSDRLTKKLKSPSKRGFIESQAWLGAEFTSWQLSIDYGRWIR